MQKSPLTTTLLLILVASALASLGLFFLDVRKTKQLRSYQATAQQVNNSLAGLNVLANECAEYGKKNPSIMPILEALAAKPAKTNPTPALAPRPAGK